MGGRRDVHLSALFGDEKKEKKGKVRRRKLLASYVFKKKEKTWMRPRSMGTENEHGEWSGREERMRFLPFTTS
ncbi:hypothetical protein PRIPAC_96597 [Pristionchus pacificus]|uniref:Uncharacterized protein n=1 Tax=Pristionchus pacificus TaxID=54126 RepID=A0A2A6D0N3_PRIPA|nr:hypothetical protein PRIPAC_96597 [Pristionchus pacificus]|eukprot:PDM83930.1 hypothetical protein PRIPAC_34122 [Pristionchus pacificus]